MTRNTKKVTKRGSRSSSVAEPDSDYEVSNPRLTKRQAVSAHGQSNSHGRGKGKRTARPPPSIPSSDDEDESEEIEEEEQQEMMLTTGMTTGSP